MTMNLHYIMVSCRILQHFRDDTYYTVVFVIIYNSHATTELLVVYCKTRKAEKLH